MGEVVVHSLPVKKVNLVINCIDFQATAELTLKCLFWDTLGYIFKPLRVPFVPNGTSVILGVPIIKHIRVLDRFCLFCNIWKTKNVAT